MAEQKASNLESSLSQLETLVKELEQPNLTIDQAIDKYTEGMKLAVECRKSLNEMSQKITRVRQEAMTQLNQIEQQEANLQAQNNAIINNGNIAYTEFVQNQNKVQ